MENKITKLIELIIDEESSKFGVEAISLVEFPAIEENWVFFSKDNFLSLAKLDEEKKTLVGAVLIPDKHIPRHDQESGEDYNVYFTADTIRQAQELFMSNLRNNNATYEHQLPIQGISVVESWVKEDKEFDKSNAYGFKEMPIGTWFVQMKVNNEEVWDKVKNGEVKGFSIEGYFVDKVEQMSKPKDIIDEVNKIDSRTFGKIKELILENELKPIKMLDGEPLFRTKEEATIYAEMFKNCEGFHKHNIDGVVLYMACYTHADAIEKEYTEDDYGKKKKKYTKKYKYSDYISFANRKAIQNYSCEQCERDMRKKFDNKEIAKKLCATMFRNK